uniref:Uncharacterized protein n=1 Tax=Panagrellus redivivus TaxID=6233 RepID=A0A7E4VL59_PANRE
MLIYGDLGLQTPPKGNVMGSLSQEERVTTGLNNGPPGLSSKHLNREASDGLIVVFTFTVVSLHSKWKRS